jgi:hypothetical protein
MSDSLSVNGQLMTMDRLIATIQKYGGKNVSIPQVPPNNLYAFLPTGTLVDNTGSTDVSALIKTAHDAAQAAGWRTMWFPVGTYYAPTLAAVGNVIFVGPGVLKGAYRKPIIPEAIYPGELTNNDMMPIHRKRWDQAVGAATKTQPAILVLIGDSTTEIGAPIDYAESQRNTILRRLRETYGPQADNIVVLNYGIGGTTWATANADPMPPGFNVHPWQTDLTKPWLYYVINPLVNGVLSSPDAVIYNFGQNDTSNFDLTQMQSVIAKVTAGAAQRFGLPPDVWIQTPYAPSVMCNLAQATQAGQEGRDFVAGYERTYAQRYGYGLIDVGRVAAMARDGFDIRNTRFTQTVPLGTVTFPFTYPNTLYDFDFNLQVTSNPITTFWNNGMLQVPLSSKVGNVLLLECDSATGFLAYTVYAATGILSVARVLTAQPVNFTNVYIDVSVSGSQISIRTGTLEVDITVERHGGQFIPVLSMTGGVPSSATIQLSAAEGIPLVVGPFLLDVEQFGYNPGGSISGILLPDGGNGINHQTDKGFKLVTARAYNATKFG